MRLWLILAMAAAVIAGAFYFRSRPEAPPELPALEGVEAGVAQRLRSLHARLLDDPEPEDWLRFAKAIHVHYIDPELAVVAYRRAAEDAEDPFEATYLAGLIQVSRGGGDAAELLQKATELRPRYAPAWLARASLDESAGRQEQAAASYERALEIERTSHALLGVARAALRNDEVDEGVRLLEEARSIDPEHGAVHAALARAYARAGRSADAQRASEKAGDLDQTFPVKDSVLSSLSAEAISDKMHRDRAMARYDADDFTGALEEIEQAVQMRPEQLTYRVIKASVLLQLKRYAEARSEYEWILAKDPSRIDARSRLASCLLQLNEEDIAIAQLRSLLAEHPDHIESRYVLGYALRARDPNAAAVELVKVLKENRNHVDANFTLAQIFLANKLVKRAAMHLQIVLNEAPNHEGAKKLLDAITKP